MKNYLFWVRRLPALVLVSSPAFAQSSVRGHHRRRGRCRPHRKPTRRRTICASRPRPLPLPASKPGDKVTRGAQSGGGYFTRIFSKLVGPTGKVYTFAAPRPNAPPPTAPAGTNATPLSAPLAEFATPEPVDVVWTSRNYHELPECAGRRYWSPSTARSSRR